MTLRAELPRLTQTQKNGLMKAKEIPRKNLYQLTMVRFISRMIIRRQAVGYLVDGKPSGSALDYSFSLMACFSSLGIHSTVSHMLIFFAQMLPQAQRHSKKTNKRTCKRKASQKATNRRRETSRRELEVDKPST